MEICRASHGCKMYDNLLPLSGNRLCPSRGNSLQYRTYSDRHPAGLNPVAQSRLTLYIFSVQLQLNCIGSHRSYLEGHAQMTPFSALCGLAGLSLREASEFLHVPRNTINSWTTGRRSTPPGALDELQKLIHKQRSSAEDIILQIHDLAESNDTPAEIEIGFPANEHEAKALGWPSVGAWAAMAARVIASSQHRICLVPREPILAPATASDARD